MKHLLYPLFGVLVLSGYYYTASRGIDLFATDAERHMSAGPVGSHGRPAGGLLYGGFAGGK